jgi:hypothetical protein
LDILDKIGYNKKGVLLLLGKGTPYFKICGVLPVRGAGFEIGP